MDIGNGKVKTFAGSNENLQTAIKEARDAYEEWAEQWNGGTIGTHVSYQCIMTDRGARNGYEYTCFNHIYIITVFY